MKPHIAIGIILGALLLLASPAMALDLPRMVLVPHDTLYLSDNSPIFGTIVEIDAATGVITFQNLGESFTTNYRRGQWLRYEHKRLQDATIRKRGEILLAAPPEHESDLLLTLNWGLEEAAKERERGDDERADAIMAAAQRLVRDAALGGYAGNERVARLALTLLADEPEMAEDLETIIRAVFATVPGFELGFRMLADLLERQGREQDLLALARQWVDQSRSSIDGNRLLARLVERGGNLTEARDAYSRLYLHPREPDLASGVAYARCNFLLGSHTRAAEIARDVMEAGKSHPDVRIILASDLLRRNDAARLPRILELLEEAVSAEADERLRSVGLYNLGLAQWRAGDGAAAAQTWRRLGDQAAAVGLAMVERRVLRSLSGLPAALVPVAREANAVLLLEQGDTERARALLEDQRSRRHAFLRHVADVIDSNGAPAAVAALVAEDSDESRRWQLYGHIRGGRLDQARAVADRLPAHDGYAAVCRVFLAAVDRDEDEARRLYQAALRSDNPPAAYLEQIARQYEQEHDAIQVIDFSEWAPGHVLRDDWRAHTQGTGIDVRLDGTALVLGGQQRPVDPAETRVWTTVPAASLRHVQVTCDLSGIATAHAGIEVRSADGRQAVALAVDADGSLVWRERHADGWSAWQSLTTMSGVTVTLALELDPGATRVWTRVAGRRIALGGARHWSSDILQIGVFGLADAGTNWQLRVRDMTIQQRAGTGSQGGPRRRR